MKDSKRVIDIVRNHALITAEPFAGVESFVGTSIEREVVKAMEDYESLLTIYPTANLAFKEAVQEEFLKKHQNDFIKEYFLDNQKFETDGGGIIDYLDWVITSGGDTAYSVIEEAVLKDFLSIAQTEGERSYAAREIKELINERFTDWVSEGFKLSGIVTQTSVDSLLENSSELGREIIHEKLDMMSNGYAPSR